MAHDSELPHLDTVAIVQAIADSSPTPFFVLDRTGLVRFTNQALDTLLGWNRYEVLQTPWSGLFSPGPGAPSFTRCLEDALRGVLHSYEVVRNGPDGNAISLKLSLSTVGDGAASAIVLRIDSAFNLPPDTPDVLTAIVCHISTGEDFGRLLAFRGSPYAGGSVPQEGEHCFQFFAKRQEQCGGCPFRRGVEGPWPRTRIHHGGVDDELMRVVVHFQPKASSAKLLVHDFPDSLVGDILQSKVRRLGKDSHLTDREQEVLGLVLLGRSLEEIAIALSIAPRTAKFHQANLLRKMGAESKLDIFRLIL